MIVFGVDIETTGLDHKTDEVTEIAYCLYDLIKKQEIFTFSSLVKGKRRIPDEVINLNGITNEMRDWGGMEKETIKPNMRQCIEMADFVAAHNAEFEKGFLGKNLGRPWIDTAVDVPYPPHITTRKLTHLCADHGLLIRGAHRALNDVRAMLELLSLYDPAEVKKYAESPTLTVQAMVEYDTREKAKERGYRWNGEQKIWTRPLKEFQLEDEKRDAPFTVKVLAG